MVRTLVDSVIDIASPEPLHPSISSLIPHGVDGLMPINVCIPLSAAIAVMFETLEELEISRLIGSTPKPSVAMMQAVRLTRRQAQCPMPPPAGGESIFGPECEARGDAALDQPSDDQAGGTDYN